MSILAGIPESGRRISFSTGEVLTRVLLSQTLTVVYLQRTWKQAGTGEQRIFFFSFFPNSLKFLLIGSTRHLRLKFDSTSRNDEEEIWVLLTRHVVDTRRTSDFISLRVQLEDDLAGSADSGDQRKIATKVPCFSAARYANSCPSQGTYTNSTHVLVRAVDFTIVNLG